MSTASKCPAGEDAKASSASRPLVAVSTSAPPKASSSSAISRFRGASSATRILRPAKGAGSDGAEAVGRPDGESHADGRPEGSKRGTAGGMFSGSGATEDARVGSAAGAFAEEDPPAGPSADGPSPIGVVAGGSPSAGVGVPTWCGPTPNGTSTVNVEPFPTSLSTPMVPPMSSTSAFVMARPSPVPAMQAGHLVVLLLERIEHARQVLGMDAAARVGNGQAQPAPLVGIGRLPLVACSGGRRGVADAQNHLPARPGELERVAHQVVDDLAEPQPVPYQARPDVAGDVGAVTDATLARLGAKLRVLRPDELRQVERLAGKRQLAAFDLAHVQNVVDQQKQVLRRGVHLLEARSHLLIVAQAALGDGPSCP